MVIIKPNTYAPFIQNDDYDYNNKQTINNEVIAVKKDCIIALDDWYTTGDNENVATNLVNLIKTLRENSKNNNYLAPKLKDIPDPGLLKDCTKSAQLISDFIIRQKKIIIHGDYDADGISACSLLARFFRNIGYTNFDIFIPDRFEEGYGISKESRSTIMGLKPDCIITVDNGINSKDEINFYNAQNIATIVADHHQPMTDNQPDGLLINPKQTDCKYPEKHLVATSVCFLLLIEIRRTLRKLNFWNHPLKEPLLINYLDLVTIATIADNGEMLGLNRLLVYHGLKKMNAWLKSLHQPMPIYFRVLCEKKYINQEIDGESIAFKLAPLINAAGRIKHAKVALDFLTNTTKISASEHFEKLIDLNKIRRRYQEKMFNQAKSIVLSEQQNNDSIVVWHETFHEGVIGIVASKLVDKFKKPAIVLAPAKNCWKGSGRCPAGFDLISLLTKSNKKLIKYGGHKEAVGLSIQPDDIGYFSKQFDELASDSNKNTQLSLTRPLADIEIESWMATRGLYDLLKTFAPFGTQNPRPNFLIRGISLKSPIYKSNNLNKWRLNKQVECITFSDYKPEFNHGLWNIVGCLKMAYYNNYSYLQFIIQKIFAH